MNMNKFRITDFYIYRWRYFIGYGIVAIGLVLALIFAGMYLPGGISNQEIQSVIKSNSTNFSSYWSLDVINLPYYILQHFSLSLFGVTILSIKLPSIILAFLSTVGLVLLLRQWFKPSIGVLASLIAITTGQFLFIAQNGTPDVLYLFWPVWILFIAGLIPIQKRLRKLFIAIFLAITALSLYTPLSIYVIIVMIIAIILHPHLRFLIKQLSKQEVIGGIVLILVLVSPLLFAIIKDPNLCMTLLGIPTTWPNFNTNLLLLGSQYFNFSNPSGQTIITPFFELGSMLLIALGVYFVIRSRATAKNYVIILWTALLIPIIILNPNLTSITFLPLVLLIASGLNGLLGYWYGLFPRNPYARIGGLIPLIILISILIISGSSRYIYEYRYNPEIVPNFSQDLNLIPITSKNIVVSNNELAFYQIIAKHNKQLIVSTTADSDTILVTRAAKQQFANYNIFQIITTSASNQSDRFYIYKKINI